MVQFSSKCSAFFGKICAIFAIFTTIFWETTLCIPLGAIPHGLTYYMAVSYAFWRHTCFHFNRAMLCISAVYAVKRCPSIIRLSVTFVDHVKTNKHIFEIFSLSGSHTILVFSHQTWWRYSDGNPPNGGVECRWSVGTNRDSGLIAGYRRLLDVRTTK